MSEKKGKKRGPYRSGSQPTAKVICPSSTPHQYSREQKLTETDSMPSPSPSSNEQIPVMLENESCCAGTYTYEPRTSTDDVAQFSHSMYFTSKEQPVKQVEFDVPVAQESACSSFAIIEKSLKHMNDDESCSSFEQSSICDDDNDDEDNGDGKPECTDFASSEQPTGQCSESLGTYEVPCSLATDERINLHNEQNLEELEESADYSNSDIHVAMAKSERELSGDHTAFFYDPTSTHLADEFKHNNISCDEYEQDFDNLVKQLNEEAKANNYENLIDDTCTIDDEAFGIPTMLEQVAEALENDHEKNKTEIDRGEEPIFTGSKICLGAAVLLLCCLQIRYRLSDEALAHVLAIISLLLPSEHRMVRTVYRLRKFVKEVGGKLIPEVHYCCSFCYATVDNKSDRCSNKHCLKDLTDPNAIAYFVELSILAQLQVLWKQSDFANKVRTHRFDHYAKKKRNAICDVYDGIVYKKLFDDGVLDQENNLSFAMNTDGVPLFKSSNVSMWPTYLIINELPIALRKRRCNVLFFGIWISSRKPLMSAFFEPLYKVMTQLENGVEFTDSTGLKFTSKCALLFCTCDLPARAMVYNFMQFNGYNSCWYCKQAGSRHYHESGGSSHVFLYDGKTEKRTDITVRNDVKQACENIKNGKKHYVVNGHRGEFWFMYLKYTPLIYSCVIDYMHGACLGIMKMLLNNWFSKDHKTQSFSYFNFKGKVSTLLKAIRPALYVTRVPRTLDDLKHWKSSEYRNFILYWGLVVMKGILSAAHYAHFALFCRAIYLLSKESIEEHDLVQAEVCIDMFVKQYSTLYNEKGYTMNLHQLLHLVDCVKNTGPLFCNNCFLFEDLNGFIMQHVHGTKVETQILNVLGLIKVAPILHKKYVANTNMTLLEDLCQDTLKLNNEDVEDELENGVKVVGKTNMKVLNEQDFQVLHAKFNLSTQEVTSFLKINMYRHGFYVYGEEYSRLKKRQQSVVSFWDVGDVKFGIVKYFVNFQTDRVYNVAVISLLNKVEPLGCLWKVTKLTDVTAIPLCQLLNVCMMVENETDCFVAPPPNRYDRD